MVVLVIAGESIFLLPFVMPRIFSTVILDVFEMSKTSFGNMRASYGVVAIAAYFLGGPLADKFLPNKLMSVALITTALGGFFLTTIPGSTSFFWLYAFWGASTIMLFWAALMRTTRALGGNLQGTAFGILDGGRGLTAALITSVGLMILSAFVGDGSIVNSAQEKADAFSKVVLFFSCFVVFAGVLVLFALRRLPIQVEEHAFKPARIFEVLKLPAVQSQSLMILCAYSAYRVTDNFTILAKDVLEYSDVESAWLGTMALWLRPIAAIGAGVLADRIKASTMMMYCFGLLLFAGFSMFIGPVERLPTMIVISTVAATSVGVFALRGLYFAIMGEGKIPLAVTGTAVGIASIIGYLPDVYMLPLMGWLNDMYPGLTGHRYIFGVMALFAIVGLLTTWVFRKKYKA